MEDGVRAGVAVGDDVAGNADDGCIRRHVGDDDGASADGGVFAHFDRADELGSCAYLDVVLQGWVALLPLRAGAAEGDALVEVAVVADLRRFADDDAHAVIDEETLADRGAGVDLNAGEIAGHVGDHSG